MIIIISGSKGEGKSTFARQLAKSVWPQTADVTDKIPDESPKYFSSVTIYTHQSESPLPQWIRDRTDYTVINLQKLNEIKFQSNENKGELFQNYIKKKPIKAFKIKSFLTSKYFSSTGSNFIVSPSENIEDGLSINEINGDLKVGGYLILDGCAVGQEQTYSFVNGDFFENNYKQQD